MKSLRKLEHHKDQSKKDVFKSDLWKVCSFLFTLYFILNSLPPFAWITASVWTNASFSDESIPESMVPEFQCEVSTVSEEVGCRVICWCWSTHFSSPVNADILEYLMLPSAHTAKDTKSWFNGHGLTVPDWPVYSPDKNPIENLWVAVKRRMRDTDQVLSSQKWTYFSEAWYFCWKHPFLMVFCNIQIFWDTQLYVFSL